jgi:hypothetical protein
MKTARIFVYSLIIIIILIRFFFHLDIPFLYPLLLGLAISAFILELKLLKLKK